MLRAQYHSQPDGSKLYPDLRRANDIRRYVQLVRRRVSLDLTSQLLDVQ